MAETVPPNVFDRLEREWRLIDPERQRPEKKAVVTEPLGRLKVGRFDQPVE